MENKLHRISGDIFDAELQDTLQLDGLVLQVCYGFNPVDAAWMDYKKHRNMRIDDNTMVFAYNAPGQKVPTMAEFPVLVARELDVITARGCRRIGTNTLWFRDADGSRKGGAEADEMLDSAIGTWLATGDNSTRVDAIYVVDKYAKGIDTADDIKFKASFADALGQIGIQVKDDEGDDISLDGLLGLPLDKD